MPVPLQHAGLPRLLNPAIEGTRRPPRLTPIVADGAIELGVIEMLGELFIGRPPATEIFRHNRVLVRCADAAMVRPGALRRYGHILFLYYRIIIVIRYRRCERC